MRIETGMVVSAKLTEHDEQEQRMAVQLVTSAEMKGQCGKKITKNFSW